MAVIYETKNFIIETHERPEIDRVEGGHIKISPKFEISDRTEMTPEQAVEFVRLSIIAGKAFKSGMAKQGIDIGRINYQENGNWKPHFHLHLYGRAKIATVQKYGEPITPGHKPEFHPLNETDIAAIRAEIEILLREEEFQDANWHL